MISSIRLIRLLAVCAALSCGGIALAGPVNINTASAEQLAEELDGVGLSKARAIVAHRNANGPFASAEALAEVKGIGERTVALNVDNILLSDESREN